MLRSNRSADRGRVGLRHVTEGDLPLLIEAAGNPQMRGIHQPSRMGSPHDVRKRFAETGYSSEDGETLIICDEHDQAIGTIVHFLSRRYATAREIGWIIYDEARRGRGYASEAASLLIDHLFESRPLHRLECGTTPGNIASQRVAEKLGFRLEGVARGLMFVGGAYVDGLSYALLRPEWEALRSR
jgi:RimJ/RimL family protein N-acetyltransferase